MRFFIVSLAALGANLVVLHLLVVYGGLGRLLAQAIAIVLVTPLNFVGNKLWSFRLRK
jgi:putative flippase GtrA